MEQPEISRFFKPITDTEKILKENDELKSSYRTACLRIKQLETKIIQLTDEIIALKQKTNKENNMMDLDEGC